MPWMAILKEAVFLLLAFLDGEFTKRKLSEVGIEAELNPLIRGLCRVIGIERGVDLGIVLPTLVIAAIGWYFPEFLAFMIGMRSFLFLLQCRARQEWKQ